MLCSNRVPLKQFLNDYKHQPALVMHWIIVGPSHQENRPAAGGVLRAYRECDVKPSPVVKSIVNTFFLANMASNPHTFEYRSAPSSSHQSTATSWLLQPSNLRNTVHVSKLQFIAPSRFPCYRRLSVRFCASSYLYTTPNHLRRECM
jgi:hypothetical protein